MSDDLYPEVDVNSRGPREDGASVAVPVRKPRRIIHCSDGVLEEYSTDEEDEEDADANDSGQQIVDPSTLPWLPWFWFRTKNVFSIVLQGVDYCGEKLAWYLGITSPKYQYAIDEYYRLQHEKQLEEAAVADDAEAEFRDHIVIPPTAGSSVIGSGYDNPSLYYSKSSTTATRLSSSPKPSAAAATADVSTRPKPVSRKLDYQPSAEVDGAAAANKAAATAVNVASSDSIAVATTGSFESQISSEKQQREKEEESLDDIAAAADSNKPQTAVSSAVDSVSTPSSDESNSALSESNA